MILRTNKVIFLQSEEYYEKFNEKTIMYVLKISQSKKQCFNFYSVPNQ